MTDTAAAEEVGVETRTWNKYTNDKSEPDYETFARICRKLRLDPAVALNVPPVVGERDEFEMIDVMDVRAAAGAGAFSDAENSLYKIAFRAQWLRSITSAPVEKLRVIEADGDSMEPMIRDGDHLLVDLTDTNPHRNGIYVIEWNGAVNVKRITANIARKTLSIASDNPIYAVENDVSPADVTVNGRVIWIGRRV